MKFGANSFRQSLAAARDHFIRLLASLETHRGSELEVLKHCRPKQHRRKLKKRLGICKESAGSGGRSGKLQLHLLH